MLGGFFLMTMAMRPWLTGGAELSRTEQLRSYSGLLSRTTPVYIPTLLRSTFPRYSGPYSCATPVHHWTGLDSTQLAFQPDLRPT